MNLYRSIFVAVLIIVAVAGVQAQTRKCDEPDSITAVKRTASKGFEYLIFEVRKNPDPDSPFSPERFRVERANPPFTDYSGEETIPVEGEKFRNVVFSSVNLFSDDYPCEIDLSRFTPGKLVEDVKLLYAFEGVADFALGFDEGAKLISSYSYDAGNFRKTVLKFGRSAK